MSSRRIVRMPCPYCGGRKAKHKRGRGSYKCTRCGKTWPTSKLYVGDVEVQRVMADVQIGIDDALVQEGCA